MYGWYSQILNILKLDINPENSTAKVLPARFIVFLNHWYFVFWEKIASDFFFSLSSFYYFFPSYSNSPISYFLEERQKIHKCNGEMSDVHFCLTTKSNDKERENNNKISSFYILLHLLYYYHCDLIVLSSTLIFPSCLWWQLSWIVHSFSLLACLTIWPYSNKLSSDDGCATIIHADNN